MSASVAPSAPCSWPKRLITQDQLDAGLVEHAASGKPLGRIFVERGQLSEVDLAKVMAAQAGLEYVDLADYPVDRVAIGLIPEAVARRYRALPIGWSEGRLVVAMADPTNVFALDDIHALTKAEVQVVVVTKDQLVEALDRFHRLEGEAGEVAQIAADSVSAADEAAQGREAVDEAPIVRFVNLLITQAVADRASDIHVEPAETDLRIRFRVDGVLHEVMRSPRSIQAGVISRLKIMADINIAERRLPQDGRMSLTVGGRTVDLRVATHPTVHGEKVVLRILDTSQASLDLADLGFRPEALRRYEACFRKPYGTILVTGPTGSGKSTTLYATLNLLNQEDRNIITVEDPVEYRMADVNQIQINPRAGLTFAAALRSILRADPDIILVGRDPRPGDGGHRHRGRPDRPPRAVDPPHQRRRLHPHAAHRDGGGAVPRHQRPRLRRGPAPGPAPLRPLQGPLRADPGRAGRGGLAGLRARRAAAAVPAGGLPRLLPHRLPGPPGHPGGAGHVGGDRAA